ncbi:hypothetical protein HJD18_09535 [Thermoleophilia bacterium SCSIO 60948]|nr:hypothetical protein HJD18_09535 [Thermoleophilia bacterium SCSIO 60948]
MKPSSISGVTCRVADLERSAEFYETIGFRRGKEEQDRLTFYVNWFFVTLVAGGEDGAPVGEGIYLYVKVENADDFHAEVLAAGLEAESEPERQPNGNREFTVRDPDGYSIVFFQKK